MLRRKIDSNEANDRVTRLQNDLIEKANILKKLNREKNTLERVKLDNEKEQSSIDADKQYFVQVNEILPFVQLKMYRRITSSKTSKSTRRS